MTDLLAALPPPAAACRACVAIPARNEERRIGATIAALATQSALDGAPLAPDVCEVLVLANNCTDATADAVRASARAFPMHRIHVASIAYPAIDAHVGTARRAVMDAARDRMAPRDGAILTTDADTVPMPTWIAAALAELATVDAVAGRITVAGAALADETPRVRAMLAAENAYRFAVARVEATFDPVPHDPWPRHWQQFGANLAVRARTYALAGGLPALARTEDLAFYAALLGVDARVRHSMRVRVATSARTLARVEGGFATHLTEMRLLATADAPYLVEHPMETLRRVRARGNARAWHAAGQATDAGAARVADVYGTAIAAVAALARRAPTRGAFVRDLERDADARGVFALPRVPVDAALAELCASLRAEAFGARGADAGERTVGIGLSEIHAEIA